MWKLGLIHHDPHLYDKLLLQSDSKVLLIPVRKFVKRNDFLPKSLLQHERVFMTSSYQSNIHSFQLFFRDVKTNQPSESLLNRGKTGCSPAASSGWGTSGNMLTLLGTESCTIPRCPAPMPQCPNAPKPQCPTAPMPQSPTAPMPQCHNPSCRFGLWVSFMTILPHNRKEGISQMHQPPHGRSKETTWFQSRWLSDGGGGFMYASVIWFTWSIKSSHEAAWHAMRNETQILFYVVETTAGLHSVEMCFPVPFTHNLWPPGATHGRSEWEPNLWLRISGWPLYLCTTGLLVNAS